MLRIFGCIVIISTFISELNAACVKDYPIANSTPFYDYFDKDVVVVNDKNFTPIKNLSIKVELPEYGSALLPVLLNQDEIFRKFNLYNVSSSPGTWSYTHRYYKCTVWTIQRTGEKLYHFKPQGDYSTSYLSNVGPIGIEHLDLSSCHLNQIPQDSFRNLFTTECIETLNISNNTLASIPSNLLENFRNLKVLDLRHNQLDSYALLNGEQKYMEKILISHNKIRTFYANTLTPYSNLSEFDISNNQLTRFLGYIGPKLKYLDLSHNRIEFKRDFFDGLPNSLLNLSLSNNQKLVLLPKLFSNLSSLLNLELRNLTIASIPINFLYGLKSLENLDLSFNNLSTLSHGAFTGLDNLLHLNLSYNNFQTIDFEIFYTKKLQSLSVAGNFLTKFNAPDLVVYLPSLKVLDLDGNRWNCRYLSKTVAYLEKLMNVKISSGTVHHSKDIENYKGIECSLVNTTNALESPEKVFNPSLSTASSIITERNATKAYNESHNNLSNVEQNNKALNTTHLNLTKYFDETVKCDINQTMFNISEVSNKLDLVKKGNNMTILLLNQQQNEIVSLKNETLSLKNIFLTESQAIRQNVNGVNESVNELKKLIGEITYNLKRLQAKATKSENVSNVLIPIPAEISQEKNYTQHDGVGNSQSGTGYTMIHIILIIVLLCNLLWFMGKCVLATKKFGDKRSGNEGRYDYHPEVMETHSI